MLKFTLEGTMANGFRDYPCYKIGKSRPSALDRRLDNSAADIYNFKNPSRDLNIVGVRGVWALLERWKEPENHGRSHGQYYPTLHRNLPDGC